ncbi:UNVERIFIED_CONTAM: hypothetical protein FKN15_023140 [Acipenser sinensis]
MKQEPAEMAVSPPLGGDELRCRLEDLVAELSVRGVQKTSASRTRNSGERIQGWSLQGEKERRAKMAEAVIGRSATRAGDQCVISVDSEDGAAAEASRRVKQEARSQWGGSGAEHRALSIHVEKIVQEEVTSSRCAGATSELLDQNKGACINKPTYDADVLYLARRGYPDYPPATQGDLAMEAFVRGLTPNALRQQVRLAAPTSLELALAHAERVEAVLEEGERDWAPGGNQREGREWTDRPRPTARQAQAEEEETADSHTAPPWISDLAALIRTVSTQAPHTRLCWNCGKPGHLQRRCPSAAAPPNCSSSEKHQGARERVAVDVLGPFPRSEMGNRFVLVALDYFTKWPEAYALADQEAETVAEALLEGFFSRFGISQELHSAQGRNFESRVFAEMCRRMGIQKTRTTPLHPQSDGLVERFNRTLAVQLAVTTASHQKDWDTQLPLVLLACRSAVQDSTACTPALLMLGRELRTPAEMIFGRPSDTPSVPPGPEYARRLQDRLEVAHHFAREQLQAAGVRQKRNYDLRARGRHFIAGELVWIFSPKRKRGRCPKLDSHWLGPCQVLERIGEGVYRGQLPPRGRKVVLHRDRLAPYLGRNPAQTDTATPDSPLLPPADSPCPASPSPSTPVPDSPLPGSSTPLDSVSPSAVADGGSTPVRPRPQRHRRLPGRLRLCPPSRTRD